MLGNERNRPSKTVRPSAAAVGVASRVARPSLTSQTMCGGSFESRVASTPSKSRGGSSGLTVIPGVLEVRDVTVGLALSVVDCGAAVHLATRTMARRANTGVGRDVYTPWWLSI